MRRFLILLVLLFFVQSFAFEVWSQELVVPASNVNQNYGETQGFLQFRGNPSHTYYGEGPVPQNPEILWRYPEKPMEGYSGKGAKRRLWRGVGWTGQPVVWKKWNSTNWEIIFGSRDGFVYAIVDN